MYVTMTVYVTMTAYVTIRLCDSPVEGLTPPVLFRYRAERVLVRRAAH